jgi:hypothetical protein
VTEAWDRLTTNAMKRKPWGPVQSGKSIDKPHVLKELNNKANQ